MPRNEVRIEPPSEDRHEAVAAVDAVADLDPAHDRAGPGLAHRGRIGYTGGGIHRTVVGHFPENPRIRRSTRRTAVQAVGRSVLPRGLRSVALHLVRLRHVQSEVVTASLS